MRYPPAIPNEKAEAFASGFYRPFGRLRAAWDNRQARLNEPSVTLPLVVQHLGIPSRGQSELPYLGHIVKDVAVMAKRLAEASAITFPYDDFDNFEAFSEKIQQMTGGKNRDFCFNLDKIKESFRAASGAAAFSPDLTMTKITLGPDPYKGKDVYRRADPFTGGHAHKTLYTGLSLEQVQTYIDSANNLA